MKLTKKTIIAALASITCGLVIHQAPGRNGGGRPAVPQAASDAEPSPTPAPRAGAVHPDRLHERPDTGFAHAVSEVSAAVVTIQVTPERPEIHPADWRQWPSREFSPGRRDGLNGHGRHPRQHSPSPRADVAGSGIILSDDGYILTNNHVVRDAASIRVKLEDGREFEADVVGADPQTDLAVIKIDGIGLATATLGDSTALEVGEGVIAIGSPYGFDRSVSSGIVSALGRTDTEITARCDLIQTDAPVNPGNSGGPLVDRSGHVIGINIAIFSPTGGSVGIGFAVPSQTASYVAQQIIETGSVKRGYLGIQVSDGPPREGGAQMSSSGAFVERVDPGSAAESAGLESGDWIRLIDGSPVTSASDLRNRIGHLRPGETVILQVDRQGQLRTLEPTLAEPEQPAVGPRVERRRQGHSGGYQPSPPRLRQSGG